MTKRMDTETYSPPAPQRYTGQWLIFWCLMAGLAAWMFQSSHMVTTRLTVPPIAPGEGVDWYLVARLPEVPAYEVGTAASKLRMMEWADGLEQAGFQPMLLSTVLSRLEQDLPLPRKTLVLVFHPGYRHTYDVLAPVLEQRRWPAVWLTSSKAIRRADRKYLNRRALERMQRSGLWDVGYHDTTPNATVLNAELAPLPRSDEAPRRFSIDLRFGNQAFNQGVPKNTIHRLSVPTAWTGQSLADRLLAEAPIDQPAHLTARRVGARVWGLAVDAKASERQPFKLTAPLQARVASVAWPGTSGKNDLLLDINFQAPLGEVWVLLRSNPAAGQAVRIGFTQEAVLIEQDRKGVRTRRARVAWSPQPGRPLAATMVLQGRRLALTVNGAPLATVDSITSPEDPMGHVELDIYDKIRGAASIGSASLIFMPLTGAGPVLSSTQEVRI